MIFTVNDNNDEKPVIIIEEKPELTQEQAESETPVIVIENDGEDDKGNQPVPPKQHHRWPWAVGSAVVTALICLAAAFGYRHYNKYVNIGVPTSITSEENIAKLQKPVDKSVKPEVVMTTDSVLGVMLNFYELRGLKAEISFKQPSHHDKDVYLYSRSCDFTSYDPKENQYIGSLVENGKELQSDVSRLGYCAMANDNVVIGIARDEAVKDYCLEQGGSFFRQFILVSNGTLPSQFYLHGKVERRALGRMSDKLYYIESADKETMWDFADAIREYGFIDAIYITGGADYCYYRTADGQAHDIGDINLKKSEHKSNGIIPWVVFKKRG